MQEIYSWLKNNLPTRAVIKIAEIATQPEDRKITPYAVFSARYKHEHPANGAHVSEVNRAISRAFDALDNEAREELQAEAERLTQSQRERSADPEAQTAAIESLLQA